MGPQANHVGTVYLDWYPRGACGAVADEAGLGEVADMPEDEVADMPEDKVADKIALLGGEGGRFSSKSRVEQLRWILAPRS